MSETDITSPCLRLTSPMSTADMNKHMSVSTCIWTGMYLSMYVHARMMIMISFIFFLWISVLFPPLQFLFLHCSFCFLHFSFFLFSSKSVFFLQIGVFSPGMAFPFPKQLFSFLNSSGALGGLALSCQARHPRASPGLPPGWPSSGGKSCISCENHGFG